MKKYQWASAELKKKAKIYNWLMLLLMALTLVIFALPDNLKVVNFLPLIGAVAFWYMSSRVQAQDRKRREARSKDAKHTG